jgi:hypothetical protein
LRGSALGALAEPSGNTNIRSISWIIFEIDLRFNRPLDDSARKYLNHWLDDEGIWLLRWRGDCEQTVVTFLVRHATREGALRLVSDQAAMLWPHEVPAGVEDVR